ncbi:acyltransferase family protein [Euryarchaeota archaeon]|nr:acyltransferase family protein [Euryarchaeota archaeon]MDA9156073.1 acyltransferase family protein [Candidatus Poseidoniaceae archaeon]MDB2542186.1 acyltransferase family protein [Candidatus Poseidoniales archaeon]MDC0656197.1 acyltransferase family protein [Candidatus Poseidoniaceae archaeon]
MRRHDIDWLRVILFGLLIWFHYAVFSLGTLVGEDSSMEMFNLPLFFVIGVMHQWRLAALFVISGMGTAFAFRRRTWGVYVKERFSRLGIPLLFGTYILFFGIFDPLVTTARLFELFPGQDNMPYGHLWFIYNLLIYSVLLTPLFSHVRNNPDGKIVQTTRSLLNVRHGMGLLLLPPLVLTLSNVLFKPWGFGEVGMWWEFPRYMLYFLFGYLMIAAKEDYFPAIDRIRISVTVITPILAIVWFMSGEMFATPHIYEGGWVAEGYNAFALEPTIAALIQSFHAWFWCLMVFSWASKLLNKPSKWLAYLNEAVYPTYIVHMHLTFLPIALFALIGLGYYLSMVIGTIVVFVGVMICFEIVRRAFLFRPMFGIKGGKQELNKLYPYSRAEKKGIQIAFSLVFNALAVGMILMLLLLIITAGVIAQ